VTASLVAALTALVVAIYAVVSRPNAEQHRCGKLGELVSCVRG